MTLPRRVFLLLSYLTAIVLLAYGVWYIMAPDSALARTSHLADTLPLVMGGRYLFFGAILIWALRNDDPKVLSVLLVGLGGLGLFDSVLYWSVDPWPHAIAGLLAIVAAVYFHKTGKVAG